MRVVVAPDSFGGTLSAVEVAEAIATGWRRGAPQAELDLVPLADGGPGFVDVLYNALGGDLLPVTVRDPLARPTAGAVLLVGEAGYVESAQACGLHLLAGDKRKPLTGSTYGVGELIAAAVRAGARRVVVGLGGSATNDGGRGMLGALGLRERHDGGVDRSALGDVIRGVDLVAATDVENPLLGPHGATLVFAPQKGADPETVAILEARMRRWTGLMGQDAAELPGAGAAGGLGYALFLLGATRESGVRLVAGAVGLAQRLEGADLVITGEGRYDDQSLGGKVCAGVAAAGAALGVPCVVLAGQVSLDPDAVAGAGVDAAYSVADEAGSVQAAMEAPARTLAQLAERVARERAAG